MKLYLLALIAGALQWPAESLELRHSRAPPLADSLRAQLAVLAEAVEQGDVHSFDRISALLGEETRRRARSHHGQESQPTAGTGSQVAAARPNASSSMAT